MWLNKNQKQTTNKFLFPFVFYQIHASGKTSFHFPYRCANHGQLNHNQPEIQRKKYLRQLEKNVIDVSKIRDE